MTVQQDRAAWAAGYAAGQASQWVPPTPPGMDALSYWAGVVEGKAARQELEAQE